MNPTAGSDPPCLSLIYSMAEVLLSLVNYMPHDVGCCAHVWHP